jgi:ribosomal protein S18 acetylase RimI-like enzyme
MAATSNVRLRAFRIADYGRVMKLWKKTEGIGLNESDTRAAVAAFLRRNPGMSAVAVSGGRVVGAILCGHDGRRGYLHHLAVAKGRRRRGLGRSLVAFCLHELHSAGIPKCNLFLFSDNHAGKVFWRRLGWQVRPDLRLVQRASAPSCVTGRETVSKASC